ncbi:MULTISPECIES: PEP-CTERM sorting domain-containing protein [unclassified Duganella]|uniref:PEP-CTERM sorting domain-containing protein n=1 Tax=unclassified Duganella TaxID=2636909 RepID=UPI001E44329D|nr:MULTISPECIES: PEP-CTERM sorting domain-containing protein [unclassified Duganella]
MAGAAQAQTVSPDNSKVATAAIVLAQCDAHSTTPCGIDSPVAAEKTASDRDPEALAGNAPVNQQAVDPVAEVPEPQTFVMLMLGLVILGFSSRSGGASDKFSD